MRARFWAAMLDLAVWLEVWAGRFRRFCWLRVERARGDVVTEDDWRKGMMQ